MNHPTIVTAWADLPRRVGPWMDMDPPHRPDICEACQPIHDARIAAVYRHADLMSELAAHYRDVIERYTAEVAHLTDANAALRRHIDRREAP